MRLLLVGDDRELANSLKGLLEQEGFRVRLALSEDFDLFRNIYRWLIYS